MEPTEPAIDDQVDAPVDSSAVNDAAIVASARRRYGFGGAMVAGGMLGLEKALGLRKVKEEVPIVMAAPTDPLDIDNDGIEVPVDESTSVYAPPQPRTPLSTKPNGIRR